MPCFRRSVRTISPCNSRSSSNRGATSLECHDGGLSSLGYRKPIGAHQRIGYTAGPREERRYWGAMLFAAAARTVAVREAWIGWTSHERDRFRYRIINNSRYLIMPGVQIPYLASHVLALVARRLRRDWLKNLLPCSVMPIKLYLRPTP